jgi:type VI secretion system protein ImpK
MATLQELFSDLFAYVLLFEQATLQGEFQPAYEQVRRDIAARLEQQKAAAKRQGILEKEYHEACFAVLAWADETILKHSTWKHHNEWKAFPLQLEYYQTTTAGKELFERLEALRTDQKEVREVYYLCLGLGFTGQYFLGMEDELKLNHIRHEQALHLTHPVENVQDIEKITAQPYAITPPEGKPITRPLTHQLLKVGLALLVVVPLGLLVYYWTSRPPAPPWQFTVARGGSGSGTVTSMPDGIACGSNCTATYASGTKVALQAAPAPGSVFSGWSGDADCTDGLVSMTASRTCTAIFNLDAEAVLKLLADQQCARVSVGLPAGGVVELGGRVTGEAQRSDIRRVVQEVKGVTQVNEALQIIPPPFCEVLDLLEPIKKSGEDQGVGFVAQLNKTGDLLVYYSGENLVITGKTPSKFESYIYVDYYTTDGMVAHLLPDLHGETMNRFGPNRSLTLGQASWVIRPPFGLELMTVMASKTALFAAPRGDEPAEAYLHELRQVLPKEASKAEVAATFHVITTRPGR